MQQIRDTWLHFLSDNLTNYTVHALRSDPNDPSASVFAMNAVNVKFANTNYGVQLSTQHVNIDVVYDAENDAVAAMQALWQILGAAFYCPLLDYTVPASPVPVGTNHITWDALGVKFRSVRSDFYSHFSCSLKLVAHLG